MIVTTRKEVVGIIEESINNDIPLTDESLEKVIYAVNNDLNIRDWVLGMPNRFTLDESIDFVRYMAVHTTADDGVPFITINAAFEYERSNMDTAVKMVEYARSINKNYSLAFLLDQWFGKLTPDIFETMRKELDPKVVEACMEEFTISDTEGGE
jgi:hypothetical protein